MLNDDQINVLSNAMVPLFNALEQEVIYDIARRVKKTMTYTRTAELQAISMEKLGYSPAKIRLEVMRILNADKDYQRAVAENTMAYKREVRDLIVSIVADAKKHGNDIVANAGKMSWIDDMSVWESAGKKLTDSSYLNALVKAYKRQTAGALDNLTQSTGFKCINGYKGIETLYRDQLNKAVAKISTGTFDQSSAIKDCIHELSHSGLRTIDYASGYSVQLDTAVKMAVRTGCHNIACDIEDDNISRSGEGLVYVQAHAAARNKGTGHANHEQWQGKVYSIDGEPHTAEAQRIGQSSIKDLWEATGYSINGKHENDIIGLRGVNCRHIYNIWFEGASSLPAKQPERKPVTIDGKEYDYYAVTQKMRLMERNIRASKREETALGRLGEDATEIKAKISRQMREYNGFCQAANVKPSPVNTSYDSDIDITKTQAYKKYIEKVS